LEASYEDGPLALSARLEIRQGQGLVITPQLQQAIKLLQLSNLEVEAFIDAELERNPLLQRDDGEAEADAPSEFDGPAIAEQMADAEARADLDATHDDASPGDRATRRRPSPTSAGQLTGPKPAAAAATTRTGKDLKDDLRES